MCAFRPIRMGVVLASVLTLGLSFPVNSQEEDLFSFIPEGGRSLLQGLIDGGLSQDVQSQITSQSQDADGWLGFLEGIRGDNAPIADLDDFQLRTLASYLAYNMPLEGAAELPQDGRDIALKNCQSCHIITVVITQDREREAWLGTLHKPSHIVVPISEEEREELSDYLVLNAGIPIDLVPPSLRAGGATY
jgi:hypothetical protein